jgi:hypothetical protein
MAQQQVGAKTFYQDRCSCIARANQNSFRYDQLNLQAGGIELYSKRIDTQTKKQEFLVRVEPQSTICHSARGRSEKHELPQLENTPLGSS